MHYGRTLYQACLRLGLSKRVYVVLSNFWDHCGNWNQSIVRSMIQTNQCERTIYIEYSTGGELEIRSSKKAQNSPSIESAQSTYCKLSVSKFNASAQILAQICATIALT